MREYGIEFRTGLLKGLRPFPNPGSGEELLYECLNLAPSPTGLIAHEPISDYDLSDFVPEPNELLTDLGAYWKLNEAAGATRNDSHGTAHMTELGGNVLQRASGKIGAAMHYRPNGVVHLRAAMQTPINITSTSWTLNYWLYIDKATWPSLGFVTHTNGNPGVSDAGLHGGTRGTAQGTAAIIYFAFNNSSLINSIVVNCSVIQSWIMVSTTYNTTTNVATLRLSHSGTFNIASNFNTLGTDPANNSATHFSLGHKGGSTADDVYLDECGLWKRELSLAELQLLWNAGAGLTYPFTPF